MSLESICICTVTRMLHGCPRHSPGESATPQSTHAMLIRILENQEKIMAAIDDLKQADADLAAAVTQAITDWTNALAGAAGANDPTIAAVVQDMQGFTAKLKAADPGAPAGGDAGSAPPAGDSGDGTGDGSAPAEGTAGSTVNAGDSGSAT